MAKTERIYNVPLRKGFQKAPKYKKAKKAMTTLKEFIARHMKCSLEDIKVGVMLNKKIWKSGIKNPPHHVKVTAVKEEEGPVKVELFGHKYPEPIKQEEPDKKKKQDKKEETEKEETEETEEKKVEKVQKPKKSETKPAEKAEDNVEAKDAEKKAKVKRSAKADKEDKKTETEEGKEPKPKKTTKKAATKKVSEE